MYYTKEQYGLVDRSLSDCNQCVSGSYAKVADVEVEGCQKNMRW